MFSALSSLCKECVAMKPVNERVDRTDDLDQSFDLALPFKGINLPFDTPVSWNSKSTRLCRSFG